MCPDIGRIKSDALEPVLSRHDDFGAIDPHVAARQGHGRALELYARAAQHDDGRIAGRRVSQMQSRTEPDESVNPRRKRRCNPSGPPLTRQPERLFPREFGGIAQDFKPATSQWRPYVEHERSPQHVDDRVDPFRGEQANRRGEPTDVLQVRLQLWKEQAAQEQIGEQHSSRGAGQAGPVLPAARKSWDGAFLVEGTPASRSRTVPA